jgi:cyclase
VVIAIDAKRRRTESEGSATASPTCEAPPGWFGDRSWDVYVNGGRSLVDGHEAVDWAREATERGAGEVLLTSMDRDGTEDGYDVELTRAVADAVPVPVIASGGAGELEHLATAISEGGADAVLCASIFHYGAFRVREAKQHLADRGIPVRL